jgi:hypothetical protein
MPVMVIPIPKKVDVSACTTSLLSEYDSDESVSESKGFSAKILLTYDPCHYSFMKMVTEDLFTSHPILKEKVCIAQLPHCANLDEWSRNENLGPEFEKVGGLIVPRAVISSSEDLHIWHIGERRDQIINIMLFMSTSKMVVFHPSSNKIDVVRGDQSR